VPACASDCEQVHVIADVAQNLKRCVVLEEQVHLNAESSNVLEHVGKLHVLGIGAEAIKAVWG
jgi:hypothetical protein